MKARFILNWAILTSSQALFEPGRLQFEDHPQDQTVIVGEDVKLTCKANLSNVKYEWLFNESLMTWHGNSLTIPSISSSGEGRYRCRATSDKVSLVSSSSLVQVFGAALIDHRPGKNTECVLGSSCQVVCSARSSKFNVTWFKNNQPVDKSLILPNGHLEIPHVASSDLGEYKCQVNFHAHRDSAITTISAMDAPKAGIVLKPTPPSRLSVPFGGNILLACHAVAPNDLVEYEWEKDGENVTLDENKKLVGLGNLLIESARGSDDGNYKCTVKGDRRRGSSSVTISLTVTDIPSPVFLNRESDLAQCVCPEEAIFYKNGKHIRTLKSEENAVKVDQDGLYQCFCPSKTLESAAMEIYKMDAPAPIPLDILEIRPSGFKVSWATSGSASGIVYLKSRDKGDQQFPFDETVELPIAVTAGDYEVKVELLELVGDTTTGPRWSQTVLVHIPQPDEVPPKVTDLQLRVNNENSIVCEWTPVDLAEDYILIIEAENMLQKVYSSVTTPFEITSIPSNIKKIRAQLHAKGHEGFSEPSEWMELELKRTTREKPFFRKAPRPAAVEDVKLSLQDTTTILATWSKPDDNQVIDGYTVRMRAVGDTDWEEFTAKDTKFIFTDLTPETAYQVRVAANAGAVKGRWSKTVVNDMSILPAKFFVDKLKVSTEPNLEYLRILNTNSTTISVVWSFGENPAEDFYTKIRWGTTDDTEYESEKLGSSIRIYKIENLKPNTDYYVSARAYWDNFQSKRIVEKASTTPLIVHKPAPTKFHCEPKGNKGLNLGWTSAGATFEIQYRIQAKNPRRYDSIKTHESFTSTKNHEFTLKPLESDKTYELQVREIGRAVESDWGETVLCTTGGYKLSKPYGIVAIPAQETGNVNIQWQIEDEKRVDGYTVFYRKPGKGSSWKSVKVLVGARSCPISGLEAETEYVFKVSADSMSTGIKSVSSDEYRHVTAAEPAVAAFSEHFWYIMIGIVALLTVGVIFAIVALVRHNKNANGPGAAGPGTYQQGSQRSDDIFELQHPRLHDLPIEPPKLVPNPYQQILPPKFHHHAHSFMTPEKAYSTRTAPLHSNAGDLLHTPDAQKSQLHLHQQNLMYQQMWEQQELLNRARHLQLSQHQLWIGQTPQHNASFGGQTAFGQGVYPQPPQFPGSTPQRAKIERAMTERLPNGPGPNRYRPYRRPMARRSMGAELAFLKLDTASSVKSSELPIARIPLKDPDSSATPTGRKSGDGESATGSVQSEKSDQVLMPPPIGPLSISNEPPLSPVNE